MTTIVIPLHPIGGKFKNNTELRFALRSLEKHFKGKYEVVILGEKIPTWITGVRHIVGGGLKQCLKIAADEFPDGFFWFYDDCCLVRDTNAEMMKITPCCAQWGDGVGGTKWGKALQSIRARLVAEGIPPWDYSRPHGPYWFDKSMVEEGFSDWPNMKSKFPWESWILSKRNWPRRHGVVDQYYGPYHQPNTGAWFVNYSNAGNTPQLHNYLTSKFPAPSKFELPDGKSTDINVEVGKPTPFLIHIPKTAGTSILTALNQNWRVPVTGTHFATDHPKFVSYRRGKNLRLFCVVRNPYDRAWSVYKFFHRDKVGSPRGDKIFRSFVQHMTCEEFWLHPNLDKFIGFMPHLRTQSSYLKCDVEVLRFESLAEEWKAFAPNRRRLLKSQVSPGVPWQEALTPKVKEVIALRYSEDFERFNYPI